MKNKFIEMLKKTFEGTTLWERLSGYKNSSVSHSQYAEDVYLVAFYKDLLHWKGVRVNGGVIVDVGANRPITRSNTYLFYKKGWTCINIEPSISLFNLLNKIRPLDINLNIAIAETETKTTFYLFEGNDLLNTIDEVSANETAATLNIVPRKLTIDVLRLETVLDKYLRDKQFEVLIIDAEGLDIEILRSNNFDRYRPRVIIVEVHTVTSENISVHPVKIYLERNGYHLHSWLRPNLIFVRNDSRIALE